MHIVVFIYAFGTSLSGVVLGVFRESELGTTCWVAGYWPDTCADVDGPPCLAVWIGVIYAGIPFTVVALFLLISNIMIYASGRLPGGQPFYPEERRWIQHRATMMWPFKRSCT